MTVSSVPGSSIPRALSELRGVDPLLEDYLDRLVAPLAGLVDYEARSALRLETQEHLEVRAAQIARELASADGAAPESAMREAIRRYGPAHRVADRFVAAWFENGAQSPLLRRLGRANAVAFSRFVLAHLGYVALLQSLVYAPSGAAYALPFSPAHMRLLVPEPLPLPDQPATALLLYAYPVVAPVVAGAATGLGVPVGAARAAYNAALPLAIYSFVAGALMLPMTAGLVYGLFQVGFWLPVGALSAFLAESTARSIRYRREAP